ncbi:hypothetical protein ACH46_03365 [Gordonia phthalatica]|uniref:DUF5642 domain-containing protein n=1 Tax=Gordonia phthalatica TaxID=1136941 RepID=A0A0N9N9Q2_9ACTN|nr:hypothetical protein ACH46_03365 [Gordonia phthalatica]
MAASVLVGAALLGATACGGDATDADDIQPSDTPSSLRDYLLTAADFPPGTTFQHVAQDKLKDIDPSKQKLPKDPYCARLIKATQVKSTDSDAVVATLEPGVMVMQMAVQPTIDIRAASAAMSGRCAKQETSEGAYDFTLRYTPVRTSVDGATVFRQVGRMADTGQRAGDTYTGYVNRNNVGLTIIMTSLASSPGTEPDLLDPKKFEKYLATIADRAAAASPR